MSIQDLDREIAEARAQVATLEEWAHTDPIAALALKRLRGAETQVIATWAARHFGEKS